MGVISTVRKPAAAPPSHRPIGMRRAGGQLEPAPVGIRSDGQRQLVPAEDRHFVSGSPPPGTGLPERVHPHLSSRPAGHDDRSVRADERLCSGADAVPADDASPIPGLEDEKMSERPRDQVPPGMAGRAGRPARRGRTSSLPSSSARNINAARTRRSSWGLPEIELGEDRVDLRRPPFVIVSSSAIAALLRPCAINAGPPAPGR
jgi:hypothetical protein